MHFVGLCIVARQQFLRLALLYSLCQRAKIAVIQALAQVMLELLFAKERAHGLEAVLQRC